MADKHSYLQYKRDSKYLSYWMIRTSNAIIKTVPQASTEQEINTTGKLAVTLIVPTAQLIAKHVDPVPSTIFRLLQSVIRARKAAHAFYQQMVSKDPDPEIEKDNASHKRMIETMTKAFSTLGGDAWAKSKSNEDKPVQQDEIEGLVLANTFSSLNLGENAEDAESADEEPEQDLAHVTSTPKQKPAGKRKKGKRGKKSKTKSKVPTKEPEPEEVPLESYRIIDDEEGIVTDYLMAVYACIREWIELRKQLQGVWREVAYGGLNSAVAGTLSNVALAMVKQTEASVFVEFPGHESFETIINTITRGNVEKAMSNFSIGLHRVRNDNGAVEKVQETKVDVREEFFIYTYQTLIDFVNDFRQNRTGKPTKRTMSEINDWNPKLNLQAASKEERIKWRRAYAINWLYDLVNLFSSIVVQRINQKGEKLVLETVDWSTQGPWNKHRRLFGLNEFAGEVTALAMQKVNVDVRQKIFPHTVFQLQCIIDSFTASRGWSLGTFKHYLRPPARAFRPRRDVDLFLDRENKNMMRGYCNSVPLLKRLLERDAMLHGDEKRHQFISKMLVEVQEDFINWLGESKYMYGLNTIPPSRFSNSNANGLWEYSPYLCGVGLMEGLELSYSIAFLLMDRMPEPFCMIHLHNMLVKKGYIRQEIGLYSTLQDLFPEVFFSDGNIPTTNFHQAFLEAACEPGGRRAKFRRKAMRGHAARTDTDIHGLLDVKANQFFKTDSILGLLRKASWVPDRIADTDLRIPSMMSIQRIDQIKRAKGRTAAEDNPLIQRARAKGLSDEMIKQLTSILKSSQPTRHADINETMQQAIPAGYTAGPALQRGFGSVDDGEHPEGADLLAFLKFDIASEVSGTHPILSLNYLWVVIVIMMKFMDIEEKLKARRNPLWLQAYDRDPFMSREKRLGLTALVLESEDAECMRVIAEALESPRSGYMQHIYWDDLEDSPEMMAKDPLAKELEVEPNCVVM